MTIAYPNSLPLGLQNGRSYQLESPLQRTELASGRARQRRRFTSVPQYAKVDWLFKDVEGRAFEAWWRDVLIDGSQWFEMPLKTPMGLGRHLCRFTGVYTGPALVGPNIWSYSAELELRERAAPPPGTGEFPDFLIFASIFDIAINDYWPDHIWERFGGAGDLAINYHWPNAAE
jgi:hypothetical protein